MTKHVYQGMGVTPKYLTVYYSDRIGAVDRVQDVKVPIGELCRPEVLDQIDRELRRRLVEHWEAGQGELQLAPEFPPPWEDD